MVKNLWAYADAMHSPTHAKTAAAKTCQQKLENKMAKSHKEQQQQKKSSPNPTYTDQEL